MAKSGKSDTFTPSMIGHVVEVSVSTDDGDFTGVGRLASYQHGPEWTVVEFEHESSEFSMRWNHTTAKVYIYDHNVS